MKRILAEQYFGTVIIIKEKKRIANYACVCLYHTIRGTEIG